MATGAGAVGDSSASFDASVAATARGLTDAVDGGVPRDRRIGDGCLMSACGGDAVVAGEQLSRGDAAETRRRAWLHGVTERARLLGRSARTAASASATFRARSAIAVASFWCCTSCAACASTSDC
jgi:hypothetical protein